MFHPIIRHQYKKYHHHHHHHHQPWSRTAILASAASAGWLLSIIIANEANENENENEKQQLQKQQLQKQQQQHHDWMSPSSLPASSPASSLLRFHPFEPHRSACLSIPFFSSPSPAEKEEQQDSSSTASGSTASSSSSNLKYSPSPRAAMKRFKTLQRLDWAATKQPLESHYTWHQDQVLGVGSYGSVYKATSKATGEIVALKQIPKRHTNSVHFQQEMRAMMYIRAKGGHPHLIQLHQHFDSPKSKDYYVILDLVEGGEMFDHLMENGAYSEMDASRLVRDVAGALNFLHGIGVVHADLKPENLLLTTTRRGDSVVKLADFGCAQILEHADEEFKDDYEPTYGAPTPAYCPKESIQKTLPIQPSADMWALGVILFIMLTGAHPFDLTGDATDDLIEQRIVDPNYKIPMDSPKVTGHLSASAKNLIRRLMHPDPEKRLTALQMLQHPWVRGDTALQTKMKGSDERLSKSFRKFKTKIQAKFFEDVVKWSDDYHDIDDPRNNNQVQRKTSLIERSFQTLDTKKIMMMMTDSEEYDGGGGGTAASLDMSDFTQLLSDNIIHRHFPAGHVVYQEGQKGNHMYFINSGAVEVETRDGSVAARRQGDFFGEGALLHPNGVRSATITCLTPVHALEISREYFDKYISTQSDSELLVTLKEKDKIRKRNRAKTILALQNNMKPKLVPYKGTFFQNGDTDCDSLFILEQGKVDVNVGKHVVFVSYPGNIFGEFSVLTGRPRNCTATCVEKKGCIAQELSGGDFRKLAGSSPHIQETLKDLQLRREFKKAVVRRLNKQFPYTNPLEAWKAADLKEMGHLDKESVAVLMRELNKDYTDQDIQDILNSLDLTDTGKVTFEEFQRIFIGDIRKSASM